MLSSPDLQVSSTVTSLLVDQTTVSSVTTCNSPICQNAFAQSIVSATSLPIIQPRSFNSLLFTENSVTKSSSSSAILGELYFYCNVPSALKHLFPALLEHTVSPVTFTIARVDGVTLSTMLTSGQLTHHHVKAVLQNLNMLHSFKSHPHTPLFYNNHYKKVWDRFTKFENSTYAEVGLSAKNHFNSLLRHLNNYEREKRAHSSAVIHGDPVLTNVVSERHTGNLKFIDMRGAHGSFLSIAGDAVYDLAKLLQSLFGYDIILADRDFTEHVCAELLLLLRTYWELVESLYPSVNGEDIVIVCCGLWSSLIPLHDNELHQKKFAKVSRVLLDAIENGFAKDSGYIVSNIVRELSRERFIK